MTAPQGRLGIAGQGDPEGHVDWKAEYIARNADISITWLPNQQIQTKYSFGDVQSVGSCNHARSLVTAFEGGKVGLWNIDHYLQSHKRPHVDLSGVSPASILYTTPDETPHVVPNYTESVTVDDQQRKALFSSGTSIVGVDLLRLQRTECFRYSSTVTALSATTPGVPVTLATEDGLHLYDARTDHRGAVTASTAPYTPKILTILHRGPYAIHVAGRFPSIVTYDRRFYSSVHSTIHSGAQALTSLRDIAPSQRHPHGTILAAGLHEGQSEHGSLELYHQESSLRNDIPVTYVANRNRLTFQQRKLLYAIPHGNRFVCSDSHGSLNWVERDGTPIIRRWDITGAPTSRVEHMARKLICLGDDPNDPRADLAFWTGSAVGVLGFGRHRFEEHEAEAGDCVAADNAAEAYRDIMRTALHRDAQELRVLNMLGVLPPSS